MTFKKYYLTIIIMLLGSVVMAQGINFIKGFSWSDIKKRASDENKYVFVDVHATWCLPCKKMDAEIFSLPDVGMYYNSNFISVKLQMDETLGDTDEVRKWRDVAKEINKLYKIEAFPTFLFFSPDGELVSKVVGTYDEKQFIKLGKDAQNPKLSLKTAEKIYSKLKSEYLKGDKVSWSDQLFLIQQSYKQNEKSFGDVVADQYYQNYFKKLSTEQLKTSENLNFIFFYRSKLKTGENSFLLLYQNPSLLNKLMKISDISQQITDYVIAKEEVREKIYVDGKPKDILPDWKILENNIEQKYPAKNAKLLILNEQYSFYKKSRQWDNAIKSRVESFKTFGLDTAGVFGGYALNEFIYNDVLKYSSERKYVLQAKEWMEILIKKAPNDHSFLDTYANILYKLGKRKKAIAIETFAIKIINDNSPSYRDEQLGELSEALKKMKTGDPTWIINNSKNKLP